MRPSNARSLSLVPKGPSLKAALLCGMAWALVPGSVMAQETAPAEPESQLGEVIVTGFRASVQSSINQKRNADVVADVLSADDIGDLPALSIGEAIETITGASTHREKGGASEISIRGLGPFLGFASFNGREASNGSGDRSVNFNQFPSELISSVAIYKTQRADFVEGGVAGLIDMRTVQPLDFGRRRLQLEGRALFADYDDRLFNSAGPGFRGTVSYIDQYDLGQAGRLGLSVGVQSLDTTNPEELFTSSSTWVACNGSQVVSATSNCSEVSAAQVAAGTPYYLIPGSRTYRQFVEHDQRDAVFGALQWRPNDRLELALDYQNSRRTYTEDRQDLNFSETRRGVNNREVNEDGVLLYYTGNSSIESTPTFRIRDEQYEGGGLTVKWDASDDLRITGDLSYSSTYRSEMDRQTRLRSFNRDVNNVVVPGVINTNRVGYTFDYRNSDIPAITVDPLFDITNHNNFSTNGRVRRDELVREHDIRAARIDAEYTRHDGLITAVKVGGRLSEMTYTDFDDRVETSYTTAQTGAANLACRREFAQRDFLSNASGNTISRWAQFDPLCLFRTLTGSEDTGRNADVRAIGNRDVEERTMAAYVMADFDTTLFNLPFSGNFGLRYVNTDVTSRGLRSGLNVVTNPDTTVTLVSTGTFETQTFEGQSEAWLPSFNGTFELEEDLLLRVGLFRAMSRPDPSALGAGRTITLESGVSFASIEDAISGITANGNPAAEPLLSWNADLSLEYYPNPDSLFSAAIYIKQFNGGFAPTIANETYLIGGTPVVVPVRVDTATDENSELFGLELTVAHRFSTLPAPFDGLGVKASYNYAQSNYETHDLRLGDQVDPVTGAVTPGFVEPAGIFGLSNHVFSGSVYYEIGPVELQAIYKARTECYQKFVGGPSQNRYIRDTDTMDFRATYRVNRNLSFSFEGSNLFDEPRIHDMPVSGSLREYNTYGARYYLGARYRF
jgi:iron complex outermembrane recepter protein